MGNSFGADLIVDGTKSGGDAEFAVDGTTVGGSIGFSKPPSGEGDVGGDVAGAVLVDPGKKSVGAAVTEVVLGVNPEAGGTSLSGVDCGEAGDNAGGVAGAAAGGCSTRFEDGGGVGAAIIRTPRLFASS